MTEFDLRALLEALHSHDVRFVVIGGVAVGALDVVQRARGVPSYSQLSGDAVESELLGIPVQICSLSRLREMKVAQSRTQDLLDLENLPEA